MATSKQAKRRKKAVCSLVYHQPPPVVDERDRLLHLAEQAIRSLQEQVRALTSVTATTLYFEARNAHWKKYGTRVELFSDDTRRETPGPKAIR